MLSLSLGNKKATQLQALLTAQELSDRCIVTNHWQALEVEWLVTDQDTHLWFTQWSKDWKAGREVCTLCNHSVLLGNWFFFNWTVVTKFMQIKLQSKICLYTVSNLIPSIYETFLNRLCEQSTLASPSIFFILTKADTYSLKQNNTLSQLVHLEEHRSLHTNLHQEREWEGTIREER